MELAEKSKILMGKLKKQSDLILTARKERLRMFQPQVGGPEPQCDAPEEPDSIADDSLPDLVTLTINPTEIDAALNLRKPAVFLLNSCTVPFALSDEVSESFKDAMSHFVERRPLVCRSFITSCCTCRGKCTRNFEKLGGSLKSLMTLFSGDNGILVYSHGRGVAGFEILKSGEYSGVVDEVERFLTERVALI
jgi:hypothetical protein